METTSLKVIDQINVKFENLDPHTRRKITEHLKFMVPYARHMPQFKLGRWDGKVGFATVGGATYLNLLDYRPRRKAGEPEAKTVLEIVTESGYQIDLEDLRPDRQFSFPEITEHLLADKLWPAGHPAAGQPIMLRDYQVEAIKRYLDNPQSIQSISTGAGKTILSASLSMLVEPYGRSIVIVPNKSLVEQTEEDYRNVGLDVGVFYGDRKEWNRTHTICTWQSLTIFAKKDRRGELEVSIDEFLKDVVCVMVDEVHSAKANELKELLCGPMAGIPIRWGLTGTVPKEEYEFISLLVSLGPVVGEIRASDLQDQGVLASCHVNVLQLNDSHVEFRSYPEEYDFLTTDPERLTWIGQYCTQLAETGNTLILVERIECGEMLTKLIPNSIFINGTVKTKARNKEYKEVQGSDGKIIVATYGVAAVGINIPRIFNLVLIEAGKSFVRVIQSIGRGIRKASDKDSVHITDITSSLKFSAKHLTKRKEYYSDAQYPFSITKVNYKDKD